MGSRFSCFTLGVHNAYSIAVAIFFFLATINNSGKRYDLANEMRGIYFQHREWKQFKDCFPKSGCADEGLCYAVNEHNVCNFMKKNDCLCIVKRNCTTEDWATVEPIQCGIQFDGMIAMFTIVFCCLLVLHMSGAIFVHFLLWKYSAHQVTHYRYYPFMWILQIYHVVIIRIFFDDIGNYDGLYWKGCLFMIIVLCLQFFAGIWSYLMDKTMPAGEPRVMSNTMRDDAVGLRRDIVNLEPVAMRIPETDQQHAHNEPRTDAMNSNIISTVEQTLQPADRLVPLMEGDSPHRMTEAGHADEPNNLCLICLHNKRDVLLLPCRHLCYCQECGANPSNAIRHCVYCRKQVQSVMKIYIP